MMDDNLIEKVKGEDESYSDDSLYNITSFGVDMSFREIVAMYKEGDLEKPELQRKYVWTKVEASRFVDSVLLGLPVPSIMLAKEKDDKRLIVDGYQRIMTIYDYIEGVFSGDGKVFRLSNTENIHPNWRGKAYSELTEDQRRRIRNSPIHAIIFEQKQPSDDTGMYQIFERINTSGRTLKPQEIRNCVYHGRFNQLLFELNANPIWRKILGSIAEDSRMADVELILRFFAFSSILKRPEIEQKQINLVKYLNVYMSELQNTDDDMLLKLKDLFISTMTFLSQSIGSEVFRNCVEDSSEIRWAKRVNPVLLDSISSATVIAGIDVSKPDKTLLNKYIKLLQDEQFVAATKERTTNTENIRKRISRAAVVLFGIAI